jgi:hypothetical protein
MNALLDFARSVGLRLVRRPGNLPPTLFEVEGGHEGQIRRPRPEESIGIIIHGESSG